MKNAIKTVLFSFVAGAVVFVGIDYIMSIPTVKMSYSINACIEVENYPSVLFGTSEFNCENMPTKFNNVWVQ